MEHMIWTNDVCDTFDSLKEDPEWEGMDDNDIWNEAYSLIEMGLEDEEANLDIDKDNNIILVGIFERWDRPYSVYKDLNTNNIGKAIREAINSFDGDNTFEIYVEDEKMLIKQWGHDNPTNPSIMEFRVLTDAFDDAEDDSPETLCKCSLPLGADASKVYGWEVAA